MYPFVAMLLGAQDEVDQSGKCALVVQQFICSVVGLCIGEQKCCRDQDDIGLVILYDVSVLRIKSRLSDLLQSSTGQIGVECSRSAWRTGASLVA